MKIRKPTKAYADRLMTAWAILHDRRCMTCGIVRADLQPGHYFHRTRQSVRWDTRNVACQCPACNAKHNNNPEPLRRVMLMRLGIDKFEQMELRSNTPMRQPDMEIICAILYYQIKDLEAYQRLSFDMKVHVMNGRFTNRNLVAAVNGVG